MNLNELQQNWDKLAREDAMWAVLTDPDKRGRKWTPAEFFQTGEEQIGRVLKELSDKGVKLKFGCALDFGSGVGRLTQALAGHFAEVHGVDIAPLMIEQAQSFNRFPNKCHYHLNSESDLKRFPDQKFDFIYTFIVLQHIQGDFVLQYLREFVRVLGSGGIAMFQFIEPPLLRRMLPLFMLRAYRKWHQKGEPYVWEFGVSRARVDAVLRDSGAKILHQSHAPSCKPGWSDYTYIITRS